MDRQFSLESELKLFLMGLILWIPIGFVFGPLLLLFFVIYLVVHKLAEKFHPDLVPLSNPDNFMALAPSYTRDSSAYTCQVWKVKGSIDIHNFRRHFHQCFLSTEEDRKRYANLYCLIVRYLGYVFKKKVKQIDLEYHIQELELGEGVSVEGFVGNWMVTHDVDTKSGVDRPVWMIKIINPRNNSDGMATMVFKLHHSICDGYTMVHLTGKLSGEHAPYLFRDPVPPLLKKVKCLVQSPYIIADLWYNMYKSRIKGNSIVQNADANEKWFISFCTLDLETIKEVRRVTRTNFVSVLMSIQVGALKRFLKELKFCGDGEKQNLPMETFLGHSMGWPQHPVMTNGGGMANHLTLNIIKASMAVEDTLERLLNLDKSFRKTKSKGYPILTYYGLFNIWKLLPCWIHRYLLMANLSIAGVETGLSSLLCSSKPHSLMGQPVQNLYLPVVLPSIFPQMKLMTVPVSHSGILDISVNASSALVKHQEALDRVAKTYFAEEPQELRKRCQNLVE